MCFAALSTTQGRHQSFCVLVGEGGVLSNLATLRDLVELDLDDSGNAIWATGDIDRAIKRALIDYSHVRPQQVVGTITLSADGREISLSTLTGLIRVVRVWYPYTSTDPEDPPSWVRWELWGGTLYIASGDEPADTLKVRVYYHKVHIIDGLDGESSTTIPGEDEEVVVLGAGAYAALQEGRAAVAAAGVSTETPEHWLRWALTRMDAFKERLDLVRRRELLKVDKRVPMDRDGWDRGAEYRDGV